MFKWHDVHLPTIARRDLKYLTTFIVAVTLMFLSAIMSFACFYIERKFGIVGHTKPLVLNFFSLYDSHSQCTEREREGEGREKMKERGEESCSCGTEKQA